MAVICEFDAHYLCSHVRVSVQVSDNKRMHRLLATKLTQKLFEKIGY